MRDPLALGFGRAANDYERGRPGWDDAPLDLVTRELGLEPSDEVVDLAAGTGKLTTHLVERFGRVHAVEPDERMRAVLAEVAPGAVVTPGFAEAIPLPAESADAVFCAEAFHWFDTDAALAEIARILRPRGGLVLLWSPKWDFEPQIPDAVRELLHAIYDRAGRPGGAKFETGVSGDALRRAGFDPAEQAVLEHIVGADRDTVASLWLSVSSVASLEPEEHAEVGAFLRGELEPTYRMRVVTEVYWTRLRP